MNPPPNASLPGIVACLALSGLFSAVETAFTSLSVFQIEAMKRRGRMGKVVERLARKPDELISTILIGNNVVNIAATALATRWALETWGDWVLGIVTAALTVVILIFGEVTPKRVAIAHNEAVAAALAPFLLVCTVILKPVVVVVNAISSLITRLFGKPRKGELSMDTMLQMLSIAEHMGILDYAKSSMVKNVFRLGATTVQAVMTHRMDVFSLDASTSLVEACRLSAPLGHSRVAVYSKTSENVTGVADMRAALVSVLSGESKSLADIMEEPVFVLPNKPLADLFSLFKKRRKTFAVVIDEYGGLAGIVTMRDVIEEIVGEIYEDQGESPRERVRARPDGSYAVSGDAPLSIVAEISGGEAPSMPYVQTVAGYIAWCLDRIPVPGDVARTPLGSFVVERTEANRVENAVYHPAGRE